MLIAHDFSTKGSISEYSAHSVSLGAAETATPDADQLNDTAYLKTLQKQMQKFAESKLSDYQLAEDAVQEALIGAMKNAKSFSGKSAFKTWVFAILKNKIADILRKRHRTVELTNLSGNSDDDDFSTVFDERGGWTQNQTPNHWGDPEMSFKQGEFWKTLKSGLAKLPEQQARVFMMREYMGLSSNEICEQESLTVSNLHVLLYRARMRLQKFLDGQWFSEASLNA